MKYPHIHNVKLNKHLRFLHIPFQTHIHAETFRATQLIQHKEVSDTETRNTDDTNRRFRAQCSFSAVT